MDLVDSLLLESIEKLITKCSSELPQDVQKVILKSLKKEKSYSSKKILESIIANEKLAKSRALPICQDTGTLHFYIYHPIGFSTIKFKKLAQIAIAHMTQKSVLRPNAVHSITGINSGNNLGEGIPDFHFIEHAKKSVQIYLMMKGGGCENVGIQFSLPEKSIDAQRDLDGIKKAIMEAVFRAQGLGCAPGVLGVAIGGDRATAYAKSKELFLRPLDDENSDPVLNKLEKEIVTLANELGIGPMGLGGRTTLLGCKIVHLHRLPASFFVTISYMCHAYRRRGITLKSNGEIHKFLI